MKIKVVYLNPKIPTFHTCTKHIEIHHHLVQDKTKDGFIKMIYCNIQNMVLDILSKELSIHKHE